MSTFEHIFSPGGMYECCSKFAMFLMLTWNKYNMLFQFFYNSAFWDLSNVDIFKHSLYLTAWHNVLKKFSFLLWGVSAICVMKYFFTQSCLLRLTCQTLLKLVSRRVIKIIKESLRVIKVIVKSVQNDLVDFNYFLLEWVNRFINKVINVLSLVMYCLIFSILDAIFKRH